MFSILNVFQKKSSAENELQENPPDTSEASAPWSLFEEGQLLIDMFERPKEIVVRALVAGVNPQDLEIHFSQDMLTIRGVRNQCEEIHEDSFFTRECYWGNFSRSVIIPVPVHHDQIRAHVNNGIITIELPKAEFQKHITLETSATDMEEREAPGA